MKQIPERLLSGTGAMFASLPNNDLELNCRILLAEDGADNQRLISYIVRRAGAHVTLARNGQVALDEALIADQSGQPYDVILMDIDMPVMNGHTATRRLRDAGFAGYIIALTANTEVGDEEECYQSGCDAYVTKPVNRARLLTTISDYVDKPRVASEVTPQSPTPGSFIPGE